MDEKGNKDQIQCDRQRYPDSIGVGNWIIQVNDPLGFVVKNTVQPEEYHFQRHTTCGGKFFRGRLYQRGQLGSW